MSVTVNQLAEALGKALHRITQLENHNARHCVSCENVRTRNEVTELNARAAKQVQDKERAAAEAEQQLRDRRKEQLRIALEASHVRVTVPPSALSPTNRIPISQWTVGKHGRAADDFREPLTFTAGCWRAWPTAVFRRMLGQDQELVKSLESGRLVIELLDADVYERFAAVRWCQSDCDSIAIRKEQLGAAA
jgi:hypothetical protein